MTAVTPPARALTARRWRSRRSAAVAGIVFAVLLVAALVMLRLAVPDDALESVDDLGPSRRALVQLSLNLVPFAGIAFLWFIGVVREQLGEVEDRLFSTVFLGSGLLFLAMLFQGAVTASTLIADGPGTAPRRRRSGRTGGAPPRRWCPCTRCAWRPCSRSR